MGSGRPSNTLQYIERRRPCGKQLSRGRLKDILHVRPNKTKKPHKNGASQVRDNAIFSVLRRTLHG